LTNVAYECSVVEMAVHVPPPHVPPEVLPGPTFAAAIFELRRWTEEAGRLHEHELAFLRGECNRLNDLSRWQEAEITRLGEQVRAQDQQLAALRGGSNDNGKGRGTKRPVHQPAPPAPPPGNHQGLPAPPKVPPPATAISVPPLPERPDEGRRKARGVTEHPENDKNAQKVEEEIVGDFVGVFKTGLEKGFGYITCEALQADVFVHKAQIGDFNVQIGAPVEFEAYWHKGHLQARHLKVPMLVQEEEILGDYIGKVKSFNAEKGFGFVTCSAIQNESNSPDVYINHKLVGGFDMTPGAPVLFEAFWHKGRLQGRNLRIPPEGSKEGPTQRVLGTYIGEIINFNDKGCAFIKCEDLDKDVFVHTKNLGDFAGQLGSVVELEAYIYKGNYQGRHLAHPPQDSRDGDVLGDFIGTVKSYSIEKGFGFLSCEDLRNESDMPECFVHKSNIGDFTMEMGGSVLFEAFWHNGRLQGRNLQIPPPAHEGGEEVLGFHIGVVRQFDPEKGFGFIDCDDLRNEKDKPEVFFHKNLSPDLDMERGMHVEFEAFWDKHGRLKAREMQEISPDNIPPREEQEDRDEEVVGTFVGVVKNFLPDKGFGFIACNDVLNEENSHDVYVHKNQLDGDFDMQAGAPVEFEAFWNQKGRLQGRSLRTPRDSSKKGDSKKDGKKPQQPQGDYLGQYFGIVKVFYQDKQFGFIACDALKKIEQSNGKTDVFLHRRFVDPDLPIQVGMEVQFEAYMNNGQVQAFSVKDVTGMDMVAPQTGVSNEEEEVSLGDHTGFIKTFNHEKGFGFITSEKLKDVSDNGEGDVWVHQSSIGFPLELLDAGAQVNFQAFLHKGRLQARNVESTVGGPAKKRKQR